MLVFQLCKRPHLAASGEKYGAASGSGPQEFMVWGLFKPMSNKPPPFKGLNIRIPSIIPIQGKGGINQESILVGLGYSAT